LLHLFLYSEVRRAALLNIPVTSATISPILLRVRDTDSHIRKLVYSSVLNPPDSQKFTGITHPRVLSIAQRELIVRHGLGDREPGVRSAAGALISSWFDAMTSESSESQSDAKADSPVLKLLALFDLAESKVAEDALLSLLQNRSDVCDKFQLDGESFSFIVVKKT
jgi:condensin complex subunit 3